MSQHDRLVTEHYLKAENAMEDAWYDEVLREEPYYENENTPLAKETGFLEPGNSGRMVGEVDVWLLNREEKLMYPIEMKTNYGDMSYGRDQLERVDEHFEEWDVYKKLVVQP